MAKQTSRTTIVVAGAVGGGFIAVEIAQRATTWALASQTNTIIVVVGGLLVGGLIAWLATASKKPASAPG
jgi:hypothetical protein